MAVVIKCTAVFQMTTGISTPAGPHRSGGWTESVYFSGNAFTDAIAAFAGAGANNQPSWCQVRAACLPVGASIVGQRYTQVNPPGSSVPGNVVFPAPGNFETDSPQQSLSLRFPCQNAPNVFQRKLRCLPDTAITEGEYTPGSVFGQSLNAFLQVHSNFVGQGRDLTQAKQPLLAGSSLGVFTLINAPVGIQAGNFVRILKAKDSSGNLRGGRFNVSAVTTAPNTVTVVGWPYGATTGGNVRLDQVVYPSLSGVNAVPLRVSQRKVGRPFGLFRGRRSRKR